MPERAEEQSTSAIDVPLQPSKQELPHKRMSAAAKQTSGRASAFSPVRNRLQKAGSTKKQGPRQLQRKEGRPIASATAQAQDHSYRNTVAAINQNVVSVPAAQATFKAPGKAFAQLKPLAREAPDVQASLRTRAEGGRRRRKKK